MQDEKIGETIDEQSTMLLRALSPDSSDFEAAGAGKEEKEEEDLAC